MDIASLFSGGKDSTYATYLAQQKGWRVRYLVCMMPEVDSNLFHIPNTHLTPLHSEAMGIPLQEAQVGGGYEDEVEILRKVVEKLRVDALLTGGVASDYQWSRFNKIGDETNLRVFTPLWRKDQNRVMREIVKAGFEVIIVGVSAEGLDESWLGRVIDEDCIEELEQLHQEKGINPSGEGGEYETLVLDAPNFIRKLAVSNLEREWNGHRGVLKIGSAGLEEK